MHDPHTALLQIRHLHSAFIHDINITLPAGYCLGLHGKSGSGKTLLLRAIADLDVNSGSVLLDGRPREDIAAPHWRRQVALLPAESQWWSDRVADHADHWPTKLLAMLGFSQEVLRWDTGRLSSGEKQRLALARLLANRPRVLLLDEPTANLDRGNTEIVEQIVLEYLDSQRAAALWVSHDPEQLERIAHDTAVMRQGRLLPEEKH